MKRQPAVAGRFYNASPEKLKTMVAGYVQEGLKREQAIGVLAPHAGLMYSGAVAGALYSRVNLPNTFVLIGPNHTGMGTPVSVFAEGEWEMPFGSVKINGDLADAIISKSTSAREDYLAHQYEHSLEVQLPFIQYFKKEFRIVPIAMMTTNLEVCQELGKSIAEAIKESGAPALIVASSDMTHYEPDSLARKKDEKAIDQILLIDPVSLHRTIEREGISMCGYAAATAMLFAASDLEATTAELVKYMTSGEVSGDYMQVVGYAGIIVK